jgi:hypothetical protein
MRIWQIEPSYLTDAFRDFYEESPLNITRILDVAQDLKVSVSSDFMCVMLNCCPDTGVIVASTALHIRIGRCSSRISSRVFELG